MYVFVRKSGVDLFHLKFVLGQDDPDDSPALPPMTHPGDMDDPYALQCAGGGYGCSPRPGHTPPFINPSYCYYGYCSYIEYINKPWSSQYGLVSQPRCVLPINLTIPPGKLRLRIVFFSGYVQKVVVSKRSLC